MATLVKAHDDPNAPQPADPWQDTKECINDDKICLSLDVVTKKCVGLEDCLYLNVNTRELPRSGVPLKPVMVHIHGGGFTIGSGTESMAGPDVIMIEDVVYVSINYRLGIFGFLSLEDTSLGVPGNNGLKDQTFALKWVQENIASFGGDPNNVTIFGISAGGTSVQFQASQEAINLTFNLNYRRSTIRSEQNRSELSSISSRGSSVFLKVVSPTAKGLFHKAIAQSGSVFNTWAWGQRNALLMADKLGKKVSGEKEALEVLMDASAEDIFKAALTIPDFICDGSVRRPFGPIIEKPNPDAFLCEDPADILRSGRFNQVPLIQGVCQDEGLFFFSKMIPQHDQSYYAKNILAWNIKKDQTKVAEWHKILKELYYKNGVTDDKLCEHMGDVLFNVGVMESTKMIIKHAKNPVFLYVFAYEEKANNIFKSWLAVDQDGISHGSDSCYLFSFQLPNVKYTQEDLDAIEVVVKMWTGFARSGKPHLAWEPVTDANNLKYLKIARNLKMLNNPFEERINVWHKILEEAGGFDLTIVENGN